MKKPKINLKTKGLINKAYKPYLFKRKKTRIFFGGSSSGKSVFAAQELVLNVLQGSNYLVTRKVAKTIRGSVWNEIHKAIHQMKLTHLFTQNKSELSFTARNNGCQIMFVGLDDVEKVKSITPQKGVITDIWVEEATEITYDDYKQLLKRLRGRTSFGKIKQLTLSFNPINKTHWIYKEFFGLWKEDDKVLETDNLLILKTTYKDNEFLTEDDKQTLENENDSYYYNVYTLGNWGVLGDVIFRNWRVEDLNEQIEVGNKLIPLWQNFDNLRYGLDFGYTHPTAFLKLHLDNKHKRIYVFDEFYESGYTNDMIADYLKPQLNGARVICDSAEPKSIQELKNKGIRATGALKGGDSVLFGIQWLKNYEIIVDVRCQNFKNEIELYQWAKDKDGNSIKRPVDKKNHLLDALRYALSEDMDKKPAGTVRAGRMQINYF